MGHESSKSRRKFLKATGAASIVGIAGCLGGEEDGGHGGDDGETPAATSPANLAPLPDSMEECTSIDGISRNPDGVNPKENFNYQYHPNYGGQGDGHNSMNVEMCANCAFYCPPDPPDKVGACTLVAGPISSQHWCNGWSPTEELTDGTVEAWKRGEDS